MERKRKVAENGNTQLPPDCTWVNCTCVYFITVCLKFWHKEFNSNCKWMSVPNIRFQSACFLIISIGPEKPFWSTANSHVTGYAVLKWGNMSYNRKKNLAQFLIFKKMNLQGTSLVVFRNFHPLKNHPPLIIEWFIPSKRRATEAIRGEIPVFFPCVWSLCGCQWSTSAL